MAHKNVPLALDRSAKHDLLWNSLILMKIPTKNLSPTLPPSNEMG